MKNYLSMLLLVLILFPGFAQAAPFKVLVVPGHDDEASGARYKGIREADLTLELGAAIFDLLRNDPLFEAHITRTQAGYMPEFARYFDSYRDAINNHRSVSKALMKQALADGSVTQIDGVAHNNAGEETAVKLYGIGNWAMDNNTDLVLHIHFNDVPRANTATPGAYTGFAVYVPERQFGNATPSSKAAHLVLERLKKYLAVSDLPKESAGVVEDQELIAIGANNSLTVPSILVEYGYIYEPQIADPKVRAALLKQLAHETYAAIREYVIGAGHTPANFLVPSKFTKDLTRKTKPDVAVLGLQAVLREQEFYPPKGKTLNECPLSGVFGPCTEIAVKAFQKAHGISQIGRVGPATRAKLNTYIK